MISPVVARIIGWNPPPAEPASKWLAVEASFEKSLKAFIKEQPERLDLGTLRIESISGDQVNFLIDGYGSDHESTHLFNATLKGQYNVLTGEAVRCC